MEQNYKKKLKLVYDLIQLASQSKMANRMLLHEVEVVDLVNVEMDPIHATEYFSFHPNGECGCLKIGDDYIFGIRCSHLVWFEGECEDEKSNVIIVCGNHKGLYMQKMIVFHPELSIYSL